MKSTNTAGYDKWLIVLDTYSHGEAPENLFQKGIQRKSAIINILNHSLKHSIFLSIGYVWN